MIDTKLLLTAVIYVFTASTCLAGDNYRCTITGILQTVMDGKQDKTGIEQYNGKTFTVERTTGVMVGALNNKSKTQPIILDIGSDESFYRVVNTIEGENGSNTCTLIIEELNKEEQKPFVFMNERGNYYGTCVHY